MNSFSLRILEPLGVTFQLNRNTPELAGFLHHCGWSEKLIEESMRECAEVQSTFISFGEPDKLFAKRLSKALREHGSQTFFFPEHARPGAPVVEIMYRGVHDNDRVILVCSEASLTRPAVQSETKMALDREHHLGGKMLVIPVAIDNYLFECELDESIVTSTLRSRVIADFRGTLDNEDEFKRRVDQLVSALKGN